jgi:transposase
MDTPICGPGSSTCAPRPARSRPPPGSSDSDNTIIQALTSQISHLKKQHRDETQALRAALEQAHGENLQLRRELIRLGWNGQLAATLPRHIKRNIDMTCKNVAFTSRNRG